MKKTDLRIGNLVMATDLATNEKENTILEVSGVGLDVDFTNGTTQNYIGIKGIKMNQEYWSIIGENKVILVDKTGFVIFKHGYAYQFIFSDYPYLHQVQNLYFSLTGGELKALKAKK